MSSGEKINVMRRKTKVKRSIYTEFTAGWFLQASISRHRLSAVIHGSSEAPWYLNRPLQSRSVYSMVYLKRLYNQKWSARQQRCSRPTDDQSPGLVRLFWYTLPSRWDTGRSNGLCQTVVHTQSHKASSESVAFYSEGGFLSENAPLHGH